MIDTKPFITKITNNHLKRRFHKDGCLIARVFAHDLAEDEENENSKPVFNEIPKTESKVIDVIDNEIHYDNRTKIMENADSESFESIKINRVPGNDTCAPEDYTFTDTAVTSYTDGMIIEMPTVGVDIDLTGLPFTSKENDMLSAKDDPENSENEIEKTSGEESDIDNPREEIIPSVLNITHQASDEKNPKISADIKLLNFSEKKAGVSGMQDAFIKDTADKLEQTIRDFGIETKVVEVSTGPVITRYELTIESGVKISRIVNLSDNLALSLAAPSVRIVAPIPGKSVIGIEIPNIDRQTVLLRDVVDLPVFWKSRYALPIALGKGILGEAVITDLASTPHLLIAGATGSGKSVCVNAVIMSLLFSRTPQEIRFLLIDPKMVELNVYNDIPHLLSPVITDPKKAALSLRWIIGEMEARYALLERTGVRSIFSYNSSVEEKIQKEGKNYRGMGTLPYIVVIIDEFADLMMVARKEIEDSVIRLAAMSRAVGIHLILATQRPSVDVITGIIKANFPSRIAFQVSSKIDSRTILDGNGADKLLGKGDMLFQRAAAPIPERIQGAFLSDQEVHKVVENLRNKTSPAYINNFLESASAEDDEIQSAGKDSLFDEAVQIIMRDRKASASYLQRKLKIGYNRAARMIEEMEMLNLVSAADGAKPREVLVSNWHY